MTTELRARAEEIVRDGYAFPEDDEIVALAQDYLRLLEKSEVAHGLLVRSLPMTIPAYQKRRGSRVQPLHDEIKAWLSCDL